MPGSMRKKGRAMSDQDKRKKLKMKRRIRRRK